MDFVELEVRFLRFWILLGRRRVQFRMDLLGRRRLQFRFVLQFFVRPVRRGGKIFQHVIPIDARRASDVKTILRSEVESYREVAENTNLYNQFLERFSRREIRFATISSRPFAALERSPLQCCEWS